MSVMQVVAFNATKIDKPTIVGLSTKYITSDKNCRWQSSDLPMGDAEGYRWPSLDKSKFFLGTGYVPMCEIELKDERENVSLYDYVSEHSVKGRKLQKQYSIFCDFAESVLKLVKSFDIYTFWQGSGNIIPEPKHKKTIKLPNLTIEKLCFAPMDTMITITRYNL